MGFRDLLTYFLSPVAEEELAQLRRENAQLTRATWVVVRIHPMDHGELVLVVSQVVGSP